MQMLHYWNPIKKAITFILFFLFWQINLIIVVTSSSSSSSSSNSNNNNNGQLIGIPTPVTDEDLNPPARAGQHEDGLSWT